MNTALAILTVVVGLGLAVEVRRKGKPMALVALQVFLVLVVSFSLWQVDERQNELQETQEGLESTQKELTAERAVRSKVQGEINRYVCNSNNDQDQLLAELLIVSLRDVDPDQLSAADREAVRIFREKLEELQDEAPCQAIVVAFLEASDTDDLKAIRRILRRQEVQDGIKKGRPER